MSVVCWHSVFCYLTIQINQGLLIHELCTLKILEWSEHATALPCNDRHARCRVVNWRIRRHRCFGLDCEDCRTARILPQARGFEKRFWFGMRRMGTSMFSHRTTWSCLKTNLTSAAPPSRQGPPLSCSSTQSAPSPVYLHLPFGRFPRCQQMALASVARAHPLCKAAQAL